MLEASQDRRFAEFVSGYSRLKRNQVALVKRITQGSVLRLTRKVFIDCLQQTLTIILDRYQHLFLSLV
ncbi:hypothetical protein NT6N_18330 [Oceaniferula spumae]|uniref:Uncharacterized protein n=1 Tax=Oceaniferula spumae TaxID=2979115 RepID=A0AAT9FLG3_9BACT